MARVQLSLFSDIHITAFGVFIMSRKRTSPARVSTEGVYRQIVETAFDAFIGMDSNGVVVDWNTQAEATFGWRRSEAIGRTVSDLIIPERYRKAHEEGLRRYFATGEGQVLNKRIEITGLHKAGHELSVELMISPIKL